MSTQFYKAVAKNGYQFYFTHIPSEGREFPILNVPNPSDYEIYEVTEEEYRKNEE